ncbi:MAG TPA: VWA domain-containing protein [Acidobacteriaceae bacterium]|nr:VWA domain-containing protein [Acidobacteriaceae bacterium]
MIPRLLLVFSVALLTLDTSLPADAQASGGSGPQSGYTFQANSRVVLTDVTVTDRKGNPVHDLKASDFHIFDNNKAQDIASFEEHRRDDVAPPAPRVLPAGVYSNDYLVHPPHVLNILLIDLTNIEIADQMYLNFQLGKFFDRLKPNEPVAIYARLGEASVLVQSFTSDPALLRAAVKRVMPRFPPLGREYMDDFQTLRQIETYVGQIPGRKNVLWFSGGSTFFLRPDATLLEGQAEWRALYDELEEQRIAIYPIDARGLTTSGSLRMLAQHALMSQVAEATGGFALYDNNGIAQGIARTIEDDGDYYTLTYSPHNFTYDNKWHKVRVALSGTYYTLSYRRGYFADGTNTVEQRPSRSRTRLLARGATAEELPNEHAPIIFQASVREGADHSVIHTAEANARPARQKRTAPFTVQYSLPLDAFEIKMISGKPTVQCGAVVIALNANGTVTARHAQEITFTLKEEAASHPAGKRLPVDVEVQLATGDVYLYLAAWDVSSKRLGSLEIPFHVDAPKPAHDTHASQ